MVSHNAINDACVCTCIVGGPDMHAYNYIIIITFGERLHT